MMLLAIFLLFTIRPSYLGGKTARSYVDKINSAWFLSHRYYAQIIILIKINYCKTISYIISPIVLKPYECGLQIVCQIQDSLLRQLYYRRK